MIWDNLSLLHYVAIRVFCATFFKFFDLGYNTCMDEETLKKIIEFLEYEAVNAYSKSGGLIRPYRNGHDQEIGSGHSRVVILQEFNGIQIAIKFVFNKRIDGNLKEWRAWHVMPESVRKMTAQPYAISQCGRVIAFEYIPQTAREFFSDSPPMNQRITEFNKELKRGLFQKMACDEDKIDHLLRDNKPDNIGVRPDGSLVWIDFASFL